jgi:non-ribosomal peptide synthetase component F
MTGGSLRATGAGTILAANGAGVISDASMTADVGGQIQFTQTTGLTRVNLTASVGGQMLFPAVATYTTGNAIASYTIQATGTGSRVDLSALDTFAGSNGAGGNITTVSAAAGGRVDLSGDPDFRGLLGRVRDVTLGAFSHGQLPFERLVEELIPERDLGHTPIFQVLFALQNTPERRFELPGLSLSQVDVSTASAKFDLVLSASETGDGLALSWSYNGDLFDSSRIERLSGHFATLLETALDDPEARVSDFLHHLQTDHAAGFLESDAVEDRSPHQPEIAVYVPHVKTKQQRNRMVVNAADDDAVQRIGSVNLVAVHHIRVVRHLRPEQ